MATSLVAATGVIDFNADPAAGDTVTIGDKTYTYAADPTGNAFEVDVGADRDESISNLVAAINLTGTADTEYGAGTTRNEYVKASADLANDEIDLTARIPGTIGNCIYLATSEVDIVILNSEVTMTGGTGDLEDELERSQLNSTQLLIFQDLVE